MKSRIRLMIIVLSVFVLVLSACRRTVYYTVNFNSKGGSDIASQQVKKGETLVLPENPTQADHEFLEWTLDGETFEDSMIIERDITLVAVWEKLLAIDDPTVVEPVVTEVTDKTKLTSILNSFSGRLGYSFCSLDLDVLSELYSGNMSVDSLSENTLLLIAMNNEDIQGDYADEADLLFNKSYLNEKIRKVLNINSDINFSAIEPEINNFKFENRADGKILFSMQIFGCIDGFDDLVKQLVKGEEDDQYLYIYERVAFGRSTPDGKMSYYDSTSLDDLIEKFDYDMDPPTSKIDVSKYPIYKYKFLKTNNEYKLMSIILDE